MNKTVDQPPFAAEAVLLFGLRFLHGVGFVPVVPFGCHSGKLEGVRMPILATSLPERKVCVQIVVTSVAAS